MEIPLSQLQNFLAVCEREGSHPPQRHGFLLLVQQDRGIAAPACDPEAVVQALQETGRVFGAEPPAQPDGTDRRIGQPDRFRQISIELVQGVGKFHAVENDLAALTSVYENMKPKEAAPLFEAMDPVFAAGFLARMRPEVAAGIMAKLSPDAAYSISVILAGRNANVPRE